MKKTNLILVCLLVLGYGLSAQTISKNFFGQNLWWSDFQSVSSPNYPSQTTIQSSGVKLMRVGGHGYNFLNDNKTTALESYPKNSSGAWAAGYVAIVDRVRAMGFEPIITLPNPIS